MTRTSLNASPSVVVALELHVKKELSDEEILEITKWAWERCMTALSRPGSRGMNDGDGANVTVGVVRG